MAAIISININLSKLDKSKFFQGKTGQFCRLDVTVNDNLSEYGQQGYVCLERSKEERDNNVQRVFCGDADVRWTDNKITTKRNLEQNQQGAQQGAVQAQPPAYGGQQNDQGGGYQMPHYGQNNQQAPPAYGQNNQDSRLDMPQEQQGGDPLIPF